MTAELRVLVTRPAGQAGGLIAELESLGFAPVHLPLLSIDPVDPLPGAERQRLLDLERYAHVIFVSANAARIGLDRMEEYWPQLPQGQRYWAVGESTAQVLEAAGLDVTRPASDMSSEGLLALPGLSAVSGERILIVKGEGGRAHLQQRLAERGALVDNLCCYRRAAASHDEAQCRQSLTATPPALMLISSGEGLEVLTRLLQPREHTNLAATPLLVPSTRVVELAQQLGWQRVQCAENASDSAMLAAVRAWKGVLEENPH